MKKVIVLWWGITSLLWIFFSLVYGSDEPRESFVLQVQALSGQ